MNILEFRATCYASALVKVLTQGLVLFCNVTPIENEFEGNIVIELSNTTPNPAKIYSNEGIAQFLFFKSETEPETTYKSKNGKYQGQTTIQVAKIK